jgi:subtilisin family serine protease
MKKITVFLFVLLTGVLSGYSQAGRYWVQFSDKNNSPYSISNPSAFLSSRAINRRTVQNIPIIINDLPVNQTYVTGVSATGAVVLNRSKWMNGVLVSVNNTQQLNQIMVLPYVLQVVYTAPLAKSMPANPSNKNDKWEIFRKLNSIENNAPQNTILQPKSVTAFDYGSAYNQIHMMNGEQLHTFGYTGEGMIIAVIDAGFYHVNSIAAFDSLYANGQILGNHDFVEYGGNVFEQSTHGMNVLSTMGGNLPGEMVGTAPKAKYWLLRSEDTGSEFPVEEYNWVSAAEFADSVGADVINSSLGYTEFDDPTLNHSYSDMDGMTCVATRGAATASSKGLIVVNSAGNSGGSFWQYISSPADADSILTIGAVNSMGSYANFSSTGPASDGRVKPDVAAQGEGTIVAGSWGGVFPGNGTSFSSPVLAGMVACLWQANPSLKNTEVIQAVKQSSSQYFNPDSLLGYGIPDFSLALLILSGKNYPNIDKGLEPVVFPNPFRSQFDLGFNVIDSQVIRLEVFDVTGRLVYFRDKINTLPGNTKIRVENTMGWENGTYIVKLYSKTQVFTAKINKI